MIDDQMGIITTNDMWRYTPDPCCPIGSITNSFTVDTLSGCKPLTINFTNNSTNATSYIWNFGDGNISTNFNTSHIYSNPGKYTVSLNAISSCGTNPDTITKLISITVDSCLSAINSQYGSNLYPTLNSGNFTLDYDLIIPGVFSIYDVLGQKVFNQTLVGLSGSQNFFEEKLANGMYFWEVLSDKKYSGKFEVIK
jgi:PKD repeat protein